MEPFTDLVFKSKRMRELWEPRFPRMRDVYSYAEFETFLRGYRRVFVWHLRPENLERDFDVFNKYDLAFYPITRSKVYGGFSHRHIPPKPNDPQYVYGVVVKCEDRSLGLDFVKSSKSQGGHGNIGEMLGYPKCCVSFFESVWPQVIDPIYEMALKASLKDVGNKVEAHFHPYANQALRYFGFRITPHLPCSAQCNDTRVIGEEWVRIMRESDHEATQWLIDLLCEPFVWDCMNGVANIDTSIFKGVTNSNMGPKRIVVNHGWE